jgi:hypothetical protein
MCCAGLALTLSDGNLLVHELYTQHDIGYVVSNIDP